MEGIILALLMNRQLLELDVKDCPALFPKKEVLIETGYWIGCKKTTVHSSKARGNEQWMACPSLLDTSSQAWRFPPSPTIHYICTFVPHSFKSKEVRWDCIHFPGVLVLISWFGIKLYTYQICLNYRIPLVIILVVESVGSKQTMGSNLVFLVLLITCPRGKIFFLAWKGIYNRAKLFIDLDSLLYSRGQSVNR